jgi:hypothetical protein
VLSAHPFCGEAYPLDEAVVEWGPALGFRTIVEIVAGWRFMRLP